MTNSLLGCPFCDGKPYVENFYDKTLFAITCLKCKATTDWYTSYEAAAAAWNTRAQTVFGMTLDEVRQMMKRDAERERTCKRLPNTNDLTATGLQVLHVENCGAKVID